MTDNLRTTQTCVEITDGEWQWRFWLSRDLRDADETFALPERWCVFVMLNPSTADATYSDPTIIRCMSFARREQCTHLGVVNLYPVRATKPARVSLCPDMKQEANLSAVRMAFDVADVLVFAWGSAEAKIPAGLGPNVSLQRLAREFGKTPMCLGRTKGSKTTPRAPRHPLYVRGDTPLEVY